MKKINRILLASILLLTIHTTSKADDTITNKTYLSSRSHGVNIALLESAGINNIIHHKDIEKFGCTIQAIAWYNRGWMDGQYWSPNNCNCFTIGTAGVDLVNATYTELEKNHLDGRLFILNTRTAQNTAEEEIAKMLFDPKQSAYGITLHLDQRLDNLLKGLFASITVPIVNIDNKLDTSIRGAKSKEFKSYFSGATITSNDQSKQAPLCYALLCGSDSITGIADIDAQLGFTFSETRNFRASCNVGITIPTGNQPTAKKAFEAVVGNGRHFGFGLGGTLDQKLWGTSKHNLMLHVKAQWRYLVENTEFRTFGLKTEATTCQPCTSGGSSKCCGMQDDFDHILYGQYRLLSPVTMGAAGYAHPAGASLTPAANILTQEVMVSPHSVFDGIVTLCWNKKQFSGAIGYNLYARQQESIRLTCRNPLETTLGKRYALIKPTLQTDQASTQLTLLSPGHLDISAAQTPSHTTHKMFLNVAYTFDEWDVQYHFSAGGHYEFAQESRALGTWGINGRFGIAF